MQLPPFLLDQWLERKFSADPPIEFDLGSSTGPVWTLRELLSLDGCTADDLLDTTLFYVPPGGTTELRDELARMEGIERENVLVTTGGAEALLLLFHLAAEPGANVVLPNPGFPANAAVARSLGLEVRHYTLEAKNNFHIDVKEIRRLLDDSTKLVLVNSPHNPTGSVLSESEMQTIHDLCADRSVQFVSDQVYHPIYHGPAVRSAARLPHATVIGDFSKALCLSGLRVGWMIEPDAGRRKQYLNARSYFTVSSTPLGECLAALALRHRAVIYDRARRIATTNLRLLDRLFNDYAHVLRWVRPRGGMTAFPCLVSGADTREFCGGVMQSGVLLAPGDCFGMPAHFRLGFAASGERFTHGIERFAQYLDKIGPKTAGQRLAHAHGVEHA